jgi:kanamycin kinase
MFAAELPSRMSGVDSLRRADRVPLAAELHCASAHSFRGSSRVVQVGLKDHSVGVLAGTPIEEIEPPHAVLRLAGRRPIRVVWRNELGGLTFELDDGTQHAFIKWAPAGSSLDLAAEAARMEWAATYTPVPRPIDQGEDAEGSWLVTQAITGETAVADRWKSEPARAVSAIGEGLRAFHEALPVAQCPFSFSAEERVADVRDRATRGLIERDAWHLDHAHLSADAALELLAEAPTVDQLVVCQGDACSPNTLIGPDGRWAGHVDIGQLGVADRWADLAVATWSATWNYGPSWESELLAAYGVEPDSERTAYYRLLWDLGP